MTILTSDIADASFVEDGKPIVHGLERLEHLAEHVSNLAARTRPGDHICASQAEAFIYWLAHVDAPAECDIDTKKGKKWALQQFAKFATINKNETDECLH